MIRGLAALNFLEPSAEFLMLKRVYVACYILLFYQQLIASILRNLIKFCDFVRNKLLIVIIKNDNNKSIIVASDQKYLANTLVGIW